MKTKQVMFLGVMLLLIVSLMLPVGCTKETVTFPDEKLEAAVRDALSKSLGEEITATELTELTMLEADNSGIVDLSGLEYRTHLTLLDLNHNQISDISPLSNLTGLTELVLWENQISDISPLSSLTSLTLLILEHNQISDVSPLVENSGLSAGDEVWLEDNNLDLREGSEDMENIRALEDRGAVVYY